MAIPAIAPLDKLEWLRSLELVPLAAAAEPVAEGEAVGLGVEGLGVEELVVKGSWLSSGQG